MAGKRKRQPNKIKQRFKVKKSKERTEQDNQNVIPVTEVSV